MNTISITKYFILFVFFLTLLSKNAMSNDENSEHQEKK